MRRLTWSDPTQIRVSDLAKSCHPQSGIDELISPCIAVPTDHGPEALEGVRTTSGQPDCLFGPLLCCPDRSELLVVDVIPQELAVALVSERASAKQFVGGLDSPGSRKRGAGA